MTNDSKSSSITLNWNENKEIDLNEIERDGLVFTKKITSKDYVCECRQVVKTESVFKKDARQYMITGVTVMSNLPSQPGQEERLLTDGDNTTLWHTNWGESGKINDKKKLELNFDLGDIYELDKAEYLPRIDAGNGTFLVLRYRCSTDGKHWGNYSDDIQLPRDNSLKTISLNGEKARFVDFLVSKAVGNYGSGLQISFFKKSGTILITNEIKFDLKKTGQVCVSPQRRSLCNFI